MYILFKAHISSNVFGDTLHGESCLLCKTWLLRRRYVKTCRIPKSCKVSDVTDRKLCEIGMASCTWVTYANHVNFLWIVSSSLNANITKKIRNKHSNTRFYSFVSCLFFTYAFRPYWNGMSFKQIYMKLSRTVEFWIVIVGVELLIENIWIPCHYVQTFPKTIKCFTTEMNIIQ